LNMETAMANHDFKNPLDPNIPLTEVTERRRTEIREWIDKRERELGLAKDAPPASAEHPDEKERGA
jgi:hypothetical protein